MTTPSAGSRSCIVLGGEGFIGSAFVHVAAVRGYAVQSVDLANYESSRGASADLLINANGNSRKYLATDDPVADFDLSVRSVIQSLQDFSTNQYVYLSTMDIYPDKNNPAANAEDTPIDTARLSPYGMHKHLAEQLVRFYAPSWLICRMAGFVGPGLKKNSIYDLLKGRPLFVSPDSTYQYLHTHALAEIVFSLLERRIAGEIYNVAAEGTMSLRDVAALLPDYDLSACIPDLPVDHCELNIDKLSTLLPIPRTDKTIHRFIKAVHSGKEALA